MEVKLTDNSKIFKNAKDEAVARALDGIGKTAERYAKGRCPVDTGRLRNSITYATHDFMGKDTFTDNAKGKKKGSYVGGGAMAVPEKGTVYIGTNVEYAQAVETKDSSYHKSGKAHFMRDAAANHGEEYKRIAETQLKKG